MTPKKARRDVTSGDHARWVFASDELDKTRLEADSLREVAKLAQALLERWDMDAGLGLLRVETEEWAERVHYLRAALKKAGVK